MVPLAVQLPVPASVKSLFSAPCVNTAGVPIIPAAVNVNWSVSAVGVDVATATLPKFPPFVWISFTISFPKSATRTFPLPSTAMPSGRLKPLPSVSIIGVAGILPLTATISLHQTVETIADEDVPVPVYRHAYGFIEAAA